jgi:hypothetical protein
VGYESRLGSAIENARCVRRRVEPIAPTYEYLVQKIRKLRTREQVEIAVSQMNNAIVVQDLHQGV